MIQGLHHVAISAKNYDELTAFYRDEFGLDTVFELTFSDGKFDMPDDWEGGSPERLMDIVTGMKDCSGRLTMFRAGNGHIEIFGFDNPVPKERSADWKLFDHTLTHLCLQVENVDDWYDRLSAKGVTFYCPVQDFGEVKLTYARDPENNIIELLQPCKEYLSIAKPRAGNDKAAGLHHAGISAINFERTKKFYTETLGMEVVFEMDFSDGRFDQVWNAKDTAGINMMLRMDNAFFEFFEFTNPTPTPRDQDWKVCDHGHTHFCLQVDDLQACYEKLLAQGVKFNCPPQDFGNVLATYAQDPDGNLIEFLQIAEGGEFLSIAG
ncbi:MAG: VOC family protein [Gammaproteobacteria bacterium]|jgi:catechol 2,3-dioxygenase-like lactoylglutathione lyase family enzyme|nr:VOC family protein [Gammaproteobacteria bacterium]